MDVHVARFGKPVDFSARVVPFLSHDEARHNLILGIISTLVERPHLYESTFMASVEADGAVVAAVLNTPPYTTAVVSNFAEAAAPGTDDAIAAAIVEAFVEDLPDIAGVIANVPVAETVARTWMRLTAGEAARRFVQGVYEADQVVSPPHADGQARRATPKDGDLALDWYNAFNREVHTDAPMQIVARQLAARLRGEGGGVDLWENEGRPVSLASFGSNTPNGARIGPVYTPPEHRRHGYATSLVAATTQHLLDAGRRFCFLYTDLDNPTSNRIYQNIGYHKVCVAEEWRFAVRGS